MPYRSLRSLLTLTRSLLTPSSQTSVPFVMAIQMTMENQNTFERVTKEHTFEMLDLVPLGVPLGVRNVRLL